METLLEASHLAKKLGRNQALQGVSFSVRAGEALGLIGPNGAGKTTLLECLAGLLPVDEGHIRFRGRALNEAGRKAALFYLPDGITPWAAQTVGWALGFYREMYAGAGERAAELVAALRLGGLLRARVGTLSKGERKRALLALALLTPQPLLLLDEPFDGLDLRQTREVMALLREHAGRGRTLLLSIHQLADAARVCDRLVLLSSGRVAGEGALDELRGAAGLAQGGLEEVFLALT